jgi:replication factor A1
VQFTSKAGKELKKRVLTLCDDSNHSVNATLWGTDAEAFDESKCASHPVMAVKYAVVSDWSGCSLNVSFSSACHMNPDTPRAFALRSWYDGGGKNNAFTQLSAGGGGGHGPAESKNLADIDLENIGRGEKADFILVRSTITFIKADMTKPPYYLACPSGDCKKKVTGENGAYECEKCNKTYSDALPRYILSFKMCDSSGSRWCTAFDEIATQLLGVTAPDVARLKEDGNQTAFEQVFQQAAFQMFAFKMKVMQDMNANDGEVRLRCTAAAATPIDFVAETARLTEEIAQMSA